MCNNNVVLLREFNVEFIDVVIASCILYLPALGWRYQYTLICHNSVELCASDARCNVTQNSECHHLQHLILEIMAGEFSRLLFQPLKNLYINRINHTGSYLTNYF